MEDHRDHMQEDDNDAEMDDDGPSIEELRSHWETDRKILDWVKQQGLPEDHPSRLNAGQKADASYRIWQNAKPPTAVAKRMVWAEEAVRRAQKGRARAEQELDDLDREYEEEREKRVQALAAARQHVRQREDHLASLSRAAAEDYNQRDGLADADVLWEAYRSINNTVGPVLEAVLGQTQAGTEQHAMLAKALVTVSTLHGSLGDATGAASAELYDIAGQSDHGVHDDSDGTTKGGSDGSTGMDTADIKVPRWMQKRGSTDAEGEWGAAAWKKNRPGAAEATATVGAGASTAAAAAAGAMADPPRDDNEARRQQLIQQARADKVDVPEEHLLQLCPEALEEWAQENLL